ncbi:GP88 family protein [Gemmata sp. SH-PL17]|uniref:GP88 family protein n=1 Tax=Gemmata sp. SH-PL17 TaxID=1630693 RepID=UPI0009EDD86D|nr:hypothetical protein [Gemmata sp. SH-PL17]
MPLKFGAGNAKLDRAILTFSLPAGHTCPFAQACQSRANRTTGAITDGPGVQFRCYAATMEARMTTVRRARWHNYTLLRACRSGAEMTRLVLDSLSPYAGFVRIHDSGDFFSRAYMRSWLDVARERPNTLLYWYTKSLGFWAENLVEVGNGHEPGLLHNVVPTASWGGREDHLIRRHQLRSARVVFSPAEARTLGLELDHDDRHAMTHGPDFALLLHGQQPSGSSASRAARLLRAAGFAGYSSPRRVPLHTV